MLQKKVCVDWGVELSSRIHVTGHENDQQVWIACGGPCVLMCLGQFWLLSFVPAMLLARLPFFLRNIKVSMTDRKHTLIPCDLSTQKWLIAQ